MSDAYSLRERDRSEAERRAVEALNGECFYFSLDTGALSRALESELGQPGLFEMIKERCPYLFASQPVFVAAGQLQRMANLVRAIESVVTLPAYRDEVLGQAPAIARHDATGTGGVFLGYDFHLNDGNLGLIEINTNAGGAMLNAILARAQRACCAEMEGRMPPLAKVTGFEQDIVAMFQNEWRSAGRTRPLRRIAIVDAAPEQQYLYPEFLLFQQLFQRHGFEAVIADAAALRLNGGVLTHDGNEVDLVYNRLTDFYLEAPEQAVLREAYLQDAVLLTPHPHGHALYADKRNLALFSDDRRLRALGVPEVTRAILLANIPRTEVVDAAVAERLWRQRRGLFFKPNAGYGSRAAYRGDKLTTRVWQEILAGQYVAQAIVAPGGRQIEAEGVRQELKFDLRNYVYEGAVQWVAARLYQGQTTNFRTPGGGFAPVYG